MSQQDIIQMFLMGSVFVLVLSIWSICVTLWIVQYRRRRKQLQQRLGLTEGDASWARTMQLWRDDYQERRADSQEVHRETFAERLECLRMDAGWKTAAHLVILAVLGLSILVAILIVLSGYDIGFAVIASLLMITAFYALTQKRITARRQLFERQFLDALGLSARALRAGHPLTSSFQLIAEEIDDPVGTLFGEIYQEQAMGMEIHESIHRVAESSHNPDLKLFATAVGIQLRSGGNLAELMDTLSTVMRARVYLNRRVRVLTAQTQLSKNILIALPILLFTYLYSTSPEYMALFFTTVPGRVMLIYLVVTMVVGAIVMQRMAVLRY
ncbi:type II secretion system F family protein [Planctomycetota bacterium]